jgi:hypothetical protein
MQVLATSWFTTNRDLVILAGILVVANLMLAWTNFRTIRASNKVAVSAERQATASEKQSAATDKTVSAAVDQLDLGREQLEQERRALLASVRPLLVDVPLGAFLRGDRQTGTYGHDQGSVTWIRDLRLQSYRLSVPIRNIGNGPAFIRQTLFATGPTQVFEGKVDRRVLAADELGNALLNVTQAEPNHSVMDAAFQQAVGHIAVGVKYSDLSGDQRWQSVLHVVRTAGPQNGRTEVVQVLIYRCDENWIRDNEPVVLTGVSDHLWS